MMLDPAAIESRLHKHVDVLAELIGERNSIRPAALEAARSYLRRELSAMGHAFTEQSYPVRGREAINLEVTIRGSRPERPTLIIGAHYDSARGTPGADDNASAVAILLEISRFLVGRRLRRNLRIVFFDCEEAPHFNLGEMGSQFHAAAVRRSGEAVMGMICLESLGYFSPQTPQQGPWPLRWIGRLLRQRFVVIVSDIQSVRFGLSFVGRFVRSGLVLCIPAALPVKWVPDIELSDHRGYWEQGFPALMITDTAPLRNPNYHKSKDRLATLDLPMMARLCRQLRRSVWRMCR